LECFHHLISLNSKSADVWYNIGYLLDKIGNFTEALKAYDAALKLTPQDDDLKWNRNLTLGMVLYQFGNYSDAIKTLNRAYLGCCPSEGFSSDGMPSNCNIFDVYLTSLKIAVWSTLLALCCSDITNLF
jgi:tetratricopeptide (TPR) repeat protein